MKINQKIDNHTQLNVNLNEEKKTAGKRYDSLSNDN